MVDLTCKSTCSLQHSVYVCLCVSYYTNVIQGGAKPQHNSPELNSAFCGLICTIYRLNALKLEVHDKMQNLHKKQSNCNKRGKN